MRALLKRVAEATLLAVTRWSADRRLAGRVLILAYHNIQPKGDRPVGDRSLHLPEEVFARQLDVLGERVDIVPLGRVLEPASNGRIRVAITWDDAYEGAMTVGVEQVLARGFPAAVFVAPGMLGGRTFWWDAVAGPVDLDPAVRQTALTAAEGDTDRVERMAGGLGWSWTEMPVSARTASEATVLHAAGRGIAIGAHSWNHPNLTAVSAERLQSELERSRAWCDTTPTPLNWLAYPYGLYDRTVITAATGAGFEGALRIDGGWSDPRAGDPFAVARLNVPAGLSGNGFGLRLAGVLG